MRRIPSRVFLLVLVAAILLVTVGTYPRWLAWAGGYLIETQAPLPADAIFVFAGDWTGERILKAAQLRKQGLAARVLVTSPAKLFGHEEGDLAIDYAAARGYPRAWFEPLYITARSTREEILKSKVELEKRGIHRLIAVTSDYHTRRAGRLLRGTLEPAIRVSVVGAPYEFFTAGGWWRTREGQKTVFLEWTKTITEAFGI